jgi:hypothetical protein
VVVENGLELVDALMRLALAARRLGMTVRLGDVPAELVGLLELLGLGDVVAIEPLRRIDEMVKPGDAPVLRFPKT